MVLKNYLQGSSGEADIENRLMDMARGEKRVRCMEKVTWKLTLLYENRWPMGICCMAQETQTGALYQPREVGWEGRCEGVSKWIGYICIPLADSC